MAWELKMQFVLLIIVFVDCILGRGVKEPQVPCFFIFGDSLVDSGNNNKLVTLAKSTFPPYGIDFHKGPTGRFSNGRTMADVTAELLGFNNYIPTFATASGQDILLGVNYASAGSGIRDESGQALGIRISLGGQLKNHQTTIANIVKILGNNETATKHLNKCLYSVGMGSNDYMNNYFMPQLYRTSRKYTPEQYATVLIQQYSQQIKTLYNYGARKVAISGLGPAGCAPFEIATHGTNGAPCVEKINAAVQLFNKKLISLVDELNNNFTNAQFIYLNIYDRSSQLLANPSSFAELLGFNKYIPPFATASGEDILLGVNYASAGSGIRKESGRILTLYNYGARKVAISGLGPIGCSPYEIALRATNGACVYEINQAVELYNKNLISLVDELNNNLNDAKFIYLNIYDRSKKLIEDPSSFGT
ncbi:hypothetical protein LguiB_004787 [Lonicera macranthoides]